MSSANKLGNTYEVLVYYMARDSLACLVVVESVVLEDSVLVVDPHDLQLDRVVGAVGLLVLDSLLYRLDLLVIEDVQLALHVMEVAFDLEALQLLFDSALREYVLRAHVDLL